MKITSTIMCKDTNSYSCEKLPMKNKHIHEH
jgi:hypothetical protein